MPSFSGTTKAWNTRHLFCRLGLHKKDSEYFFLPELSTIRACCGRCPYWWWKKKYYYEKRS